MKVAMSTTNSSNIMIEQLCIANNIIIASSYIILL